MLEVVEEQIVNQQIAITNIDDNTIVFYLNQQVTSDKVKDALARSDQSQAAIGQASWPTGSSWKSRSR